MLTLARRKDESVIIGDDLLVTVADLQPHRAALAVSRKTKNARISSWILIETRWLYVDEGARLVEEPEVSCVVLKVHDEGVRLGFIFPKRLQLQRKEIYDLVHPDS